MRLVSESEHIKNAGLMGK
jgi:hypothetical protein